MESRKGFMNFSVKEKDNVEKELLSSAENNRTTKILLAKVE